MANFPRIFKGLNIVLAAALIVFLGTVAQAESELINDKFFGGVLNQTITVNGPGHFELCPQKQGSGMPFVGEFRFRGSFRNATIATGNPEVLTRLVLGINTLTNSNEVLVRFGREVVLENGQSVITNFLEPPAKEGDIIGVPCEGLPELPGFEPPSINDSFNNLDYRDGELNPTARGPVGQSGETFQADFFICLTSLEKFTLLVNILSADIRENVCD